MENKIQNQNTHLRNIENLYRIGMTETKNDPELSYFYALYTENMVKIKSARNISEDILHKRKKTNKSMYFAKSETGELC